jgi:CBS domain containing-hemolysin-like protein
VSILWKILATLGLVALNGYFVAAEFAAVGARASRLETEAQRNLLARISLEIKKKLDLYLSACQLGITLASLGLGAVTEPAVAGLLDPLFHLFGADMSQPGRHHLLAFIIALIISTSLHVIIGEQAPKNWAILNADKALPIVAVPLVIFTYLCYPLIWVLNTLTNSVLKLTGIHIKYDTHAGTPHTEEELRGLLHHAVEQGAIEEANEKILTSAFEFGDLKVRQIMTPRTQVDYLRLDQPIREVLQTVQKSAYTRLPLCDEDIDHVIGMVHMKDLFNHLKLVPGKLRFSDEKTATGESVFIADGLPGSAVHVIGSGDLDLKQIKRDVLFVPELLPVSKLLRQFQSSHTHMAIVVDEYGATRGIVTLEDVVEEIVGDIQDEFDTMAPSDFVPEGESFKVSGLFPLHELREKLSLDDLETTDVDTIGGYIVQKLGRWPKPNDTLPLGEYQVRVLTVQQKRVGMVLITPLTQETARADGPGIT